MSFLRFLFGRSAPEVPVPDGDAVRVAEVDSVLSELRPMFLADGGDVHLLGVDGAGRVAVRLVGACGSCHASTLTLRGALEPRLRERLDWFTGLDAE